MPLILMRRFSCHYAARPGETESQALRRGYRELRDHAREHEEVVALLRSLPEQDAQGVFQRIRAGTGLGTILRQVRAGDALLQMATASLLAAAPRPPRNEEPAQSLGGDGGGGARQPPARLRQQRSKDNDSSAAASHSAENDGVYLSPLQAERVLEPRLTCVQIAPLTRVCDDEPLMRDLLEMSLRCEYQSKSAFHKDTFFQNLVAGRVEVLLVHAGDSNSFLCFVNHKATILFSVFHKVSGLHDVGRSYRIHGAAVTEVGHRGRSELLQAARQGLDRWKP
ncbi:hypothetical protein MY1884_000824 [Beauveria asiatica]